MKRLRVQLSLALVGTVFLAMVLSFASLLVIRLGKQASPSLERVVEDYEQASRAFIEAQRAEGIADASILDTLQSQHQQTISNLLQEKQLLDQLNPVMNPDGLRIVMSEMYARFVDEDLLVSLLFALLTGTAAGVLISRRLSRPLENLTISVKQFSQQHRSLRVQVAGSQEIEDLGHAFNDMAARLEQQEIFRQNMLADISHELRTPLTALDVQLRGALDGILELSEEGLASIYESTHLLIRLVEDLRLLAQAEAKQLPLHKTNVNINTMLEQTRDLFQFQAKEQGVRLELELAAVPDTLETDEQRLRQMMNNLLTNAFRHTPAGGIVTLYSEISNNRLVFGVKDTGEGIARENLEHLFDRFYRVDRARARESGGSGLGLAIVKSLVEMMDGSICVYSEGPGRGSDFRVSFPR